MKKTRLQKSHATVPLIKLYSGLVPYVCHKTLGYRCTYLSQSLTGRQILAMLIPLQYVFLNLYRTWQTDGTCTVCTYSNVRHL